MRLRTIGTAVAGFVSLLGAAVSAAPAQAAELKWTQLEPGIEYATTEAPGPRPLPPSQSIDGHVHLVRVDPKLRSLEAVMTGAGDGRPRTAAQWCRERRLAVAINMGMFETDGRTNTGYARSPGYVNNGHWADKYKAALGFGALKSGVPPLVIADLDDPSAKARLAEYGTVVQNLRLIKAGRSVWEKQERRWSEAAVALDRQGRLLFIFSRYPYTMKELNDILLALPLEIDAAMHMDGGPPASLSIHAGGVNLDLNGSFETGALESDGVPAQTPIPNVLGVRRR
ncbi:MAG TPA: phosphodiester glycosidase family protein [Polyangia bacterium]|nr:phosphodiester glycosidase family protein [Polyangia bacterium]